MFDLEIRTDNLAARVAHAAAIGSDLWAMAEHAWDRTYTSHHGRQVAPRRRDIARYAARAFKLAQHSEAV